MTALVAWMYGFSSVLVGTNKIFWGTVSTWIRAVAFDFSTTTQVTCHRPLLRLTRRWLWYMMSGNGSTLENVVILLADIWLRGVNVSQDNIFDPRLESCYKTVSKPSKFEFEAALYAVWISFVPFEPLIVFAKEAHSGKEESSSCWRMSRNSIVEEIEW